MRRSEVGSGAPAVAALPAPGRFAALRVPEYRLLWTSSLVLFLAMHAQHVARGWLAIELTGTSAGVGGVFLALGVPMFVMSPIGGVVADRFPKRTVLLACNMASFFPAALIAFGAVFGFLEYWMLLVSAAVHGSTFSILSPTLMAFTGELVARPLLPNAVLLHQMMANATKIVGPAVAGVLIGVEGIGAGGVYVLIALLILVVAGITSLLPRTSPHRGAVRHSPKAELVDGFRYVRSQPPVRLVVAVAAVVVASCLPYMALLPALATEVFDTGSSGYGLMLALSALGAVAASFWFAGLVHRISVWRLQATCGLGFALGVLLLGVAPAFGIALAVLVGLGASAAGFQATNSALVLTQTELEYQGRVQSFLEVGFGASAMMALPLGFAADAVGLRVVLVVMGSVGIAAMIWYVFARRRLVATEEALTYY